MHITIKWKKNVSLNKQLVDGDKAQIMHDFRLTPYIDIIIHCSHHLSSHWLKAYS